MAARFDLTPEISKYLDRHMIVSLIEFLQHETDLYPAESLVLSKLEVLSRTKMIDWIKNVHLELHNGSSPPAALAEQRSTIVAQLKLLQEKCVPLLKVIEDQELMHELKDKDHFNIEYLRLNHEIDDDTVESLYTFAKFKFDCGAYADAADFLFYYRILCKDDEKSFQATWGKLAAEILLESDTSMQDLVALRDTIETKTFSSPVLQLQQRAWLLHWSLFVFFIHEPNRPLIAEFFLQERYLNTIQTTCPHLLRYLTTAAIISHEKHHSESQAAVAASVLAANIVSDDSSANLAASGSNPATASSSTDSSNTSNVLNRVLTVVEQETYTFRDPITDFLRSLLIEFDFPQAALWLKECESVCKNDFFLTMIVDEFMDSARFLFFETYLKIHKSVNMKVLCNMLDLDAEATEKWTALCSSMNPSHSKLAAYVDNSSNTSSIYDRVLEKTAPLTMRTSNIIAALERRDRGN